VSAQPRSNLIADLADLALVAETLRPGRFGDPLSLDHLKAMADATADAGFSKLAASVTMHDSAAAAGLSTDEYVGIFADRGVQLYSTSLCTTWAEPDHDVITASVSRLFDVAQRSGSRFVTTVSTVPELPSFEIGVAGLRHAANVAADHGLTLNIEFLPGSGVPDLTATARLIEAVDRPNLGIILDPWWWGRGADGPDWDALAEVPPDWITVVQLNDVPDAHQGDPRLDRMADRLFPGEGVVDLVRMLETLHDLGARPIVAAEVLAPRALAQLGMAEHAARQFQAAAAVIQKHWASVASRRLRTTVPSPPRPTEAAQASSGNVVPASE
jgi:sugar phosphate isomerase/epimerase